VTFVRGINEDTIRLDFTLSAWGVTYGICCGIGLDRVNAFDSNITPYGYGTSVEITITAIYEGRPSAGYHYLACLEYVTSGTASIYGDGGSPTVEQFGAIGRLLG
jgi:hypothetical protein